MKEFIYFYAPFLVVIISVIFCFWFVSRNNTYDE
ncbi:cytochrome bd oxidase small subunit CydS [Gracilibacillus oryzae]